MILDALKKRALRTGQASEPARDLQRRINGRAALQLEDSGLVHISQNRHLRTNGRNVDYIAREKLDIMRLVPLAQQFVNVKLRNQFDSLAAVRYGASCRLRRVLRTQRARSPGCSMS